MLSSRTKESHNFRMRFRVYFAQVGYHDVFLAEINYLHVTPNRAFN